MSQVLGGKKRFVNERIKLTIATFIKRLSKSLKLSPTLFSRPFGLLDIGARGGLQSPWDTIPAKYLRTTLVEPDPNEAAQLRRDWEEAGCGAVLQTALWSEEKMLKLNVNQSPGTSSVFPSNFSLLDQFPDSQRYKTISTFDVPAKTVDGIAAANGLDHIDFAKIDAQGAELAILQGGVEYFTRNLVGIEVEVEFCPLYSGQPLFSDVDVFVRGIGLELWDLRLAYWKYERGRHIPSAEKGRLVFGDALYFRPVKNLRHWLSTMPMKQAQSKATMMVVAALVYGYVDYAITVLNEPTIAQFFESETRSELEHSIRSISGDFRIPQKGNRILSKLFNTLSLATKKSHLQWAMSSGRLGSCRIGPFWS